MFKGLGDLANIGSAMKQVQEMGAKMQALGEELKTKRATGSSGGGLIEVEVNGLAEGLSVRIDPTLIEKRDREMIEDLLPTAFNAAQKKAKEYHAEAMQQITGGVNLPGWQDALAQMTGGTSPGNPPIG